MSNNYLCKILQFKIAYYQGSKFQANAYFFGNPKNIESNIQVCSTLS